MPLKFQRLEISDVILIEPEVFKDERGFFMETYKINDFSKFGIKEYFVQDNHSRSTKGVLRGLHYQKSRKPQGKLVRAIKGEIFDVAVDIRKGSPTYGKWVGVILSAQNKKQLYMPQGFAHGFCTLSEVVEVIYKCTNVYSPAYERGILWSDPNIGINWPIKDPILSDKDAKLPNLLDADNDFVYPVR